MDRFPFCERIVRLGRRPISFAGRPYLPAIYASTARNRVVRCSRQTEKSTFLVNTILYEACTLFVCPRMEQAHVFTHTRLVASLEQSPLIRRTLLGCSKKKPPVMNMRFANDSQVYVRAAYHSADAARGISADLLLVDEFQDIAAGDLPAPQETLRHARCGRTVLTGTPKLVDNHLDAMFSQSTANEWHVHCPKSGRGAILDERCIADQGIQCPDCGSALDATKGNWVPRNPAATWGDGFWINHLMVPWLNYDGNLERRHVYDLARFKNEVLGLPTTIGEHVVTRAELKACCADKPMAQSVAEIPRRLLAERPVVAGIDWGGGGSVRTVIVIGIMRSDYAFEVFGLASFRPDEAPTAAETILVCST